MENKGKNILIGILIIVIISLLVILGLVLTGKIKLNNEVDKNDNVTTGDNINDNNVKIDKNKDYVYDANYNLDVVKDSYVTEFGEEFKVSDLIVPYINIDSKDAEEVNDEVYKLYGELIDNFNMYLGEKVLLGGTKSSYSKSINNGILSVIIEKWSGGTDVPLYNYYTYSFDLTTGERLSFKDVIKKLGYGEKEFYDKVISSIDKYYVDSGNEEYKNDNCGTVSEDKSCINSTYDDFNKNFENDEVKYYIDEEGVFKIIPNIYIPAGRDVFETLIVVN